MQKLKKLKEQKAITLVALVITIIILLILAGISISALTNQGVFKQAQNAKNLTEEKTAEENAILANYLEQMNAIIGGQVTESVPDGAIVNPVNDITTWLKTGEISKQYSYTTIEQVIADSTCTESLMKNENAMKYLARSTEFADEICASETAMTYLGDSAYVDDTVLNSDNWTSKIAMSPYWDKVSSVTVILYGAVSEQITIIGIYNSPTVTTNSEGSINCQLPIGEFTFSGSISGESFVRNINKDTNKVYVMPEHSLYWYGNECTDITGGWQCWNAQNGGYGIGTSTLLSNSIYFASSGVNQTQYASSKLPIAIEKFSNLHSKLEIKTQKSTQYCSFGYGITSEVSVGSHIQSTIVGTSASSVGIHQLTTDVSSYNEEYYVFGTAYYLGNGYTYALWLE